MERFNPTCRVLRSPELGASDESLDELRKCGPLFFQTQRLKREIVNSMLNSMLNSIRTRVSETAEARVVSTAGPSCFTLKSCK